MFVIIPELYQQQDVAHSGGSQIRQGGCPQARGANERERECVCVCKEVGEIKGEGERESERRAGNERSRFGVAWSSRQGEREGRKK